MKKILALVLALITLVLPLSLASCSDEDIPEGPYELSEAETDYVRLKVVTKKNGKIKPVGEIVVKLEPDIAPITVANFKKLVGEGFYDGLIFHRVINNFMIQGGDPQGTGIGGSDETIKGEFKSNGVENNLSHKRGVISMARNGYDMDSASSQFFIVHKDSPHLDGDYAAFGAVVYGIETVDKVAKVSTNMSDKPYDDVIIESAKFVTPN